MRKNEKKTVRERLIESADMLFSTKGYGNVGVNEIIAHAKTVKASFYQHFPSKETLCKAWLESKHEASVERHEAWLASVDGDMRNTLVDYFRDLAETIQAQGNRSCPFSNTAAFLNTDSNEIREVIQKHKAYHREVFIRLAARSAAHRAHAEAIGTLWFLLFSGLATEIQNAQSTRPIEHAEASLEWFFVEKQISDS